MGVLETGVQGGDFFWGGLAAIEASVGDVITCRCMRSCSTKNTGLTATLTVIDCVDGGHLAAQRLHAERGHCVADIT